MVNVNLTLFIELGLFLLFMWGTNRFIFRPLLRVMDEREEKMERDEHDAVALEAETEALRSSYLKTMADIRRKLADDARTSKREARNEHNAKALEARMAEENAVAASRKEARAALAAQRSSYDALKPEIISAIRKSLKIEGGA